MSWLPAAATVFSSLLQSEGQQDANEMNYRIQQENSAFNAEQAALNRSFTHQEAQNQMNYQSTMANTAWQRGVGDMKAAGLNPMLAYSQGGAPAPHGAMGGSSAAQAGSPGNMANKYAAAGASAGQWAQIENVQADTAKKEAERKFIETQERGYEGEQNVRIQQMRQATELIDKQTDLTVQQKEKVKEEVKEVIAKTKNLDADTRLKAVNEVLQRYDIPRMQAEAAYFKTPIGKESPHNKYGPQTPFRFIEGLGERIINRNSGKSLTTPADMSSPGNYVPYR